MARCPAGVFRRRLLDEGIVPEDELVETESDVEREVAEAEDFARNSADPEPSTVEEGLFA